MRAVKLVLILTHRYLGIPLSLLFVMWFVSGFFMIYTGGMPKVTPDMQVDGEEAVDFAKVTVTPQQAMTAAGYEPPAATLRTILDRPVYELADPGYGSTFVYADTGELMPTLTPEQGLELASRFLAIPAERFHLQQTLENQVDQWTFTVRRELPLYKYVADDALDTEVYVSQSQAKVSAYTTRTSRLLAWLGTIPHWLYFETLRENQKLWTNTVVWSSEIGCVVALLGLCLGVTQFRKVKPFVLAKAIPYRGLMRWHYILGCIFGVVTLTWVFSGLVSMEPWEWTNAQGVRIKRDVLTGGDLRLQEFPAPASADWKSLSEYPIKQLEFTRVLAAPYWVAEFAPVHDGLGGKRDRLHQPYNIDGQLQAQAIVVDATTGKAQKNFDAVQLAAALGAGVEGAAITETAQLDDYDDYYYSRGNQLPLPVLRVKFDDANRSWVYVDPLRGTVLSVVHRWSRLERWLYNGLHSLDFAFWYHKRPLWDIGVLLLLSGGLATSVLGLYFGLRRLKHDITQAFSKIAGKKTAGDVSHVV
ncbi:MAG TPA: hypothetical protein VMH83_01085 [Candidatus Acidoferrum sp.]|nr:hypothetical protein [Candidatus Acidoferrum sp.]